MTQMDFGGNVRGRKMTTAMIKNFEVSRMINDLERMKDMNLNKPVKYILEQLWKTKIGAAYDSK